MARQVMPKLEEYYRRKIAQEGFDLFAVFSRFEYAMKNGGFRRKQSADAAWKTFAESLPHHFFERMWIAPPAVVYFARPPKRLDIDGDDGVKWSDDARSPTNAAELFDCIKTARNNLFHGDKRHDNRRDTELMTAALFILNAAYETVEHEDAFQRFVSAMEFGL